MDDYQRKKMENLKAELRKLGIHNDEELLQAMKEQPPINIWLMTGGRRDNATIK
ncbi:hypothetical protein LJC51_07490 [Lachnospiraceae bacterium OttesenSCG-928-J05]|nr:hypothetical protein [Lachnospiraceae bacterium OttesenSCG-928-J05]